MNKTVYLNIPIEEEQVRSLKLDDIVYLSGTVYVMMFDNQFEKLMENELMDMDVEIRVLKQTMEMEGYEEKNS